LCVSAAEPLEPLARRTQPHAGKRGKANYDADVISSRTRPSAAWRETRLPDKGSAQFDGFGGDASSKSVDNGPFAPARVRDQTGPFEAFERRQARQEAAAGN
jgi:hypothetical protein